MKLLSVSDLQRTTDGVKEQQLNQTCFGNLVAPKRSRRGRGAGAELTADPLCWEEGAPGVSASPGHSQLLLEGEGCALHKTLRFQDGKDHDPGEAFAVLHSNQRFLGHKQMSQSKITFMIPSNPNHSAANGCI